MMLRKLRSSHHIPPRYGPRSSNPNHHPLDVDSNIDFSSYPDFPSLRPCLQNYFGGPGRQGTENQVAINVQCVANSCLCTPENIESNLPYITSQVRESYRVKVDDAIAQATSVLSAYCSMVTADLTTTTLGVGPSQPTSTSSPTPKDEETPMEDEPYLLSGEVVLPLHDIVGRE